MSTRAVASATLIAGKVTAWVTPELGGAVAAAQLAVAVMAGQHQHDSTEGEK